MEKTIRIEELKKDEKTTIIFKCKYCEETYIIEKQPLKDDCNEFICESCFNELVNELRECDNYIEEIRED